MKVTFKHFSEPRMMLETFTPVITGQFSPDLSGLHFSDVVFYFENKAYLAEEQLGRIDSLSSAEREKIKRQLNS